MTLKRRPAGTLGENDIGQKVLLKAWVHRRRDLGGLVFLDLRDRSGLAQVVVYPDDHPEAHEALDPVRPEWVVEVFGEVLRRENPNPDLPTGQVEVKVERAEILAPSEVPPFVLEGWADVGEETRLKYRYLDLRRPRLQANLRLRHRTINFIRRWLDEQEFVEKETRLKHRYLDLRRPELQKNFILRDKVVLETRNYLAEEGFLDLETPILTRSTPEGARDYLVPSRMRPGRFYALPQSPQIFKQLCMVSGFERYFQIARCFRDEDLRADRQPEFTQIDLEMSFVEEEEVYSLIEGLFEKIFPLAGLEPGAPYPRMTYADALARYGTDRPDLRFGCEIVDLSEVLGESGFGGFKAAVAEGGVVRGFVVPGAAGASRKQVDGWAKIAQQHGAAGVLTLRRRDGELQFQVKTALSDDELDRTATALELEEGDLALLAAGPAPIVAKALGALRLALAKEYDLIPDDRHAFLWVTDFPLLEWDEDEKRWFSLHHPFTSPRLEDLEHLESDPGRVRSRAYDVVMDGIELGGGSIRIHRRDIQERVFGALGIDEAEAKSRFGFLLEALQYGAPPHGGIALGLDRMIMLMAGAPSIRDVILYPKTASALCLLTEAPSPVDAAQLAELGLSKATKVGAAETVETVGEDGRDRGA